MAKPMKQLTAASLSLKAIVSCRLSSGGHAQRVGSSLPCVRRMPTQTQRSTSSSTRPAPAVNRVVHVEMKPLEVAQERADNKQPAKTFSPGRRKQHDKRASETTIRQQLKQVDVLENMGISRHFAGEIKRVLDRTYRCWLQRDEEIMLDTATCAMAFRILRMNGYGVSSDELYHVAEASVFQNSLGGYLNDTRTLLELHKASTVSISEDEYILDTIGSWSGTLLREQLGSGGALRRTPLFREVEHALDCPV